VDELQMRAVVKQAVDGYGSLREAARQWKVSPAYLSDVLNGRRAPGPAVLKPLGYERRVVVTYVPSTTSGG
jgi:hypothetical protein